MARTEIFNFYEKAFIYFLFDPTWKSKKFYIGKTIDLKNRLEQHLSLKELKTNNKKANWINALLKSQTRVEIHLICEVPDYMLWQEAEIAWIDFIKYFGIELVNTGKAGLAPGGMSGKTHSQITKNKMSKAHKGKTKTPEHRQNISKSKIGIKLSSQTRDKMSKSQTGRKHSAETKSRIRNAQLGKTITSVQKKQISLSHRSKEKDYSTTKSGFRGVKKSSVNRFIAQSNLNGKKVYLGCYKTSIEAAIAYDMFCRKNFGDNMTYNFPLPGERSARAGVIPQNWKNLLNIKLEV